ncbi:MAG: toll/interleukin-1 receptor domain-containing protein [Gammaproteobacteria bacterium]|nr:toll/interleukin-1 receptor domain-containing protein [Gammaproteobacteria bacterium]
MTRIFISYARATRPLSESLAQDIELHGYSVWFDKELQAGQSWWGQILENISSCDVFVFALSAKPLGSGACKVELEYA